MSVFFRAGKNKKSNPYLEKVRYETMIDGLSCQMMHIGSLDDEPETFARMEAHCHEHGYTHTSKIV